jgi:hypothetical protein
MKRESIGHYCGKHNLVSAGKCPKCFKLKAVKVKLLCVDCGSAVAVDTVDSVAICKKCLEAYEK